MRFLSYSHDDVGFGHTRRHLNLAARLAEATPGATVVFAVGREDVSEESMPPGVELARLPALRDMRGDADSRYFTPPTAARVALRAEMLESLILLHRPAVLVVDSHPLGASGELRPALDALRAIGGRAVLGIPDTSDPHRLLRGWSPAERATSARDYDRIFVYGEPLSPSVERSAALAGPGRGFRYVVGDFTGLSGRDEPALFVAQHPRLHVLGAARHPAEDGCALLDVMQGAGVAVA
jgi:predicted glycosyltransferase